MSKAFSVALVIKVAPDDTFTRALFDEVFTKLDASLLAETSTITRTIADGQEEAIPFGDVGTAKLSYIRSSRQVKAKVTSSAGVEQLLVVGTAVAEGGLWFSLGEVTALSILNNSGADVTVTAFIGGSSS